jgi:RNA-directed DNA polymerase
LVVRSFATLITTQNGAAITTLDVRQHGVVSAIEAGTPQGSPLSPLLANIALHRLDEAWQSEGRRLGVLVRYADDLVVLCATRKQAEAARELVAAVLETLGLRLHSEKTRVVQLARGAEGFDFLGFHHRMGKSRRTGRWYLLKWPSRRAMASIKAKIRDRTDRSRARLPLEWAVEDVNHAVRGWGNYFRYGNSAAKFSAIDGYVNERLAILASAKHGLQGRNWVTRFNYEWTTRLGVYRLTGTVRPTLAFAGR